MYERSNNLIDGKGFYTDKGVMMNESSALWAATDNSGNNLMNTYLYLRYSGDSSKLAELDINVGQAQQDLDNYYNQAVHPTLTNGPYDPNAVNSYAPEKLYIDQATESNWANQQDPGTPMRMSPSGSTVMGIGVAGTQADFTAMVLMDEKTKYGQQRFFTMVVTDKIESNINNLYITPNEIVNQVLDTKIPELLVSYSLKKDNEIRDYANFENRTSTSNIVHIQDLTKSFYNGPAALEKYYYESGNYVVPFIKTELFKSNTYSPISQDQFNKLNNLGTQRQEIIKQNPI